jgi:hypothetical protein
MLKATYIQVPYTSVNVVRARSHSELGHILADEGIPATLLEVPYSTGHEAGGDKVQQASRDDKKCLDRAQRATSDGIGQAHPWGDESRSDGVVSGEMADAREIGGERTETHL